MKTTTNTVELHHELTENTLAYLYESLETTRHEVQSEQTYGLDETGFLTQEARERIASLEQEERDILKNIRIVTRQLELGSPRPHIYSYDSPDTPEEEFDFVNYLDQLEKERQSELALKEIQEARNQSTEKTHELTR